MEMKPSEPVTLYELTQDEIRAFNQEYALQCIPLDYPGAIGMHLVEEHYRNSRDGQGPLNCFREAFLKASPEAYPFRMSYSTPQDPVKQGKALLNAYSLLPEEEKERIRKAYLSAFWEESRKEDAFEYPLMALCRREQELCQEKMSRLGIDKDKPLYILRPDWSMGDRMSMEEFTSNMLLDTSSCRQSRKLTYNPGEECLDYSVTRWNEKYGMDETYEAKIVPSNWVFIPGKARPQEVIDVILDADTHERDGLPDLRETVRDWYHEKYPDDITYLLIADTCQFGDVIDAFMKDPEAADDLVCGDAHLRDCLLHELPSRSGIPFRAIRESYESNVPLAGSYRTIRDILEDTKPDTSMRDWYQAISPNPLAGINMKDQSFREFLDHFENHPDEFFMEKNPRAFRAIREMVSRMTGFSMRDIGHAWKDYLTIDQCAGFTKEGRATSDEQVALLNDAFRKCHLEDWHAQRDAWYGGVVIQNEKDMRMLGDQFYREDLLEYLTTDPYFTKNPEFDEVLPVIRAARSYEAGDRDAYTELARDKEVHDRYEAIIDYPVKVYTEERDRAYLKAAFDTYKDLLLPGDSRSPVRMEEVDTTTAFDARIVKALQKEGLWKDDILRAVRDNSPQYARAEDGRQYMKDLRRSVRKLDRTNGR